MLCSCSLSLRLHTQGWALRWTENTPISWLKANLKQTEEFGRKPQMFGLQSLIRRAQAQPAACCPPRSSAPNNENPRTHALPAHVNSLQGPSVLSGRGGAPSLGYAPGLQHTHPESTGEGRWERQGHLRTRWHLREVARVLVLSPSSPWRMPLSHSAEMFPEARPQSVILSLSHPSPQSVVRNALHVEAAPPALGPARIPGEGRDSRHPRDHHWGPPGGKTYL